MLKKVAICLVLAGAPHVAAAQSVQDQVVSQLREQGFSEIRLQRTWLGRIRVIAQRDELRRELVFNPQTGEILRDYWRSADDDADNDGSPRLFNPSGGSSGSSAGSGSGNDDDEGPGAGDDEDENDDEDDDDDEDDEDDDDEDDDDEDDDDDE